MCNPLSLRHASTPARLSLLSSLLVRLSTEMAPVVPSRQSCVVPSYILQHSLTSTPTISIKQQRCIFFSSRNFPTELNLSLFQWGEVLGICPLQPSYTAYWLLTPMGGRGRRHVQYRDKWVSWIVWKKILVVFQTAVYHETGNRPIPNANIFI